MRNKAAAEARFANDGVTNINLLSADITDASAIQATADATAKITGGSLDLLINNAGISGDDESAFMTLQDMSPEEVRKYFTASFDANVVGVAITTNAFLPLIRKGGAKKVITISTGMAEMDFTVGFGIANATAYSISKSGTNMLVAKYHASLGESEGILFLAISPGLVDTSEGRPMPPEAVEGFQKMAAKFAVHAPHFTGPITPEESVRLCDAVIEKATVGTFGGGFVSQFGNKQWL